MACWNLKRIGKTHDGRLFSLSISCQSCERRGGYARGRTQTRSTPIMPIFQLQPSSGYTDEEGGACTRTRQGRTNEPPCWRLCMYIATPRDHRRTLLRSPDLIRSSRNMLQYIIFRTRRGRVGNRRGRREARDSSVWHSPACRRCLLQMCVE